MAESTKGYRRNLSLLAICQAMSVSSNALVYTVGGLVGYTLTSNKALATLPIAILVIGQALATIPAAQISRHFGRKGSFTLGTLLGATGGAIGAAGIYFQNFMVFSLALLLMGMFAGFSFSYRFAAAESVPKVLKGKAISFVLAGGVVGGILGPQLARWGQSLAQEANFLTAFVIIVAVCLFSTMVVQQLRLPRDEKQTGQAHSVRTIGELSKNLTFVVAVMSGTIGFASMTLIMSGTPIAIIGHGHTFSTVAIVIQWHIIAMYLPSFFTGALITRYGELKVIMLGGLLNIGCVLIGVMGATFWHFVIALVLCGVGWNFMYVSATSLLTSVHTTAEKAKVQGFNDMVVFSFVALAALSSGQLLHFMDWNVLLLCIVPFLMLAISMALILERRQKLVVMEAQA